MSTETPDLPTMPDPTKKQPGKRPSPADDARPYDRSKTRAASSKRTGSLPTSRTYR